jgi:hypothetical protein
MKANAEAKVQAKRCLLLDEAPHLGLLLKVPLDEPPPVGNEVRLVVEVHHM